MWAQSRRTMCSENPKFEDRKLKNGDKIGHRQTDRINEYFFLEICSNNRQIS
jgi:hypothetical protein